MNLDASRALYAATWRHGNRRRTNAEYQPGIVHRSGGITVTMASRHAIYAVSSHGLGGARHYVRAVFIAWHRGRVLGTLVWCWCGSKLITAELTDLDTVGRYGCGMCDFRAPRAGHRISVTVTVEAVTV